MTPKQRQLLDFVKQYQHERGYSPTQLEMAQAIGAKTHSKVGEMLASLKDEGQITYTPGKGRSIRVLENGIAPKVVVTLDQRGVFMNVVKTEGVEVEVRRAASN